MNKIGITNFWTNLQQLQELDECEVTVTTQLQVPISKNMKRLHKVLSNWVLFVGVCFGVLSFKVFAEWLVERMR